MDEFEDDLRATFGRMADGPEPSDDLVGRTLVRSQQIRRRRHVATGSGIAAAIVATLAVVSVAGATTRHGQVDVTGPSVPQETTTVAPTTTLPAFFPSTTAHRASTQTSVPSATPTTGPTCPLSVVDDSPADASFTLLADGNIEVTYVFPFGPARESHYYIGDDGTSGGGGFTKVYTPTEFGQHFYDEWSQPGGAPEDLASCKTRHNFVVDPSVVGSVTTTTSVPDTIPVGTTIPETTTTLGR